MKLKADSKGVLIIPEDIETISPEEFRGRGDIRKIIFNKNITQIGERAFAECALLESISFPCEAKDAIWGEAVFAKCPQLKEVNLSSSLSVIPRNCFRECTALEKIFIPSGIEKIDRCAFFDCSSLRKVIIAGKRTEVKIQAFANCEALHELIFDSRAYSIIPSFNYSGVTLVARKWRNVVFCLMQSFVGIKDGKIYGKKYYVCSDRNGVLGEGETVKRAYQDYIFHIRRPELYEAIKDKFSYEDEINFVQYRVISGSCYFGSKFFCQFWGIDDWENSTIPIPKLISLLHTVNSPDKHVLDFLKWAENLPGAEKAQTIQQTNPPAATDG